MKTEEQIKSKVIELYEQQEAYDSYDRTLQINSLKWVLEEDTEVAGSETEDTNKL